MKNYLISGISLSVLILSILGFSSCDTTLNGCPKDVYKDECLRQIDFQIYKSDSSQNIFGIPSSYYIDSVRIYNDKMDDADYSITSGGTIFLNIAVNQELSTGTEFSRTFYISLEKKDVDTIQFRYRLKYECEYFQFINFNPFYNGTQHFASSSCNPSFLLYKK